MTDNSFNHKTVILGITGSIAAYKAADIASILVKNDINVFPVMTRGAVQFISPITLQTISHNPVSTDLWEEGNKNWKPGHIELADKADTMLIAPATANIIACMSNGLTPDLLTSIYLATTASVIIAPAMNSKMWEHPATKKNIATLRERGHNILEPEEGQLACGYKGKGKLTSVEKITQAVMETLSPGNATLQVSK
jgi:phosphopantothenoylcysteine decarboxylase